MYQIQLFIKLQLIIIVILRMTIQEMIQLFVHVPNFEFLYQTYYIIQIQLPPLSFNNSLVIKSIIKYIMQPTNQEQVSSSESEDIMDRLNKKYKRSSVVPVVLNQDADITQLALQKYQELKKNYNFVSFDDVDNKKKVVSGEYQKHTMPVFDFNQNLYQYRRDGFAANPNTQIKGLIFSNKNQYLKKKTEEEGLCIDQKNEEFIKEMFEKTSKEKKKQLQKKFKEQREKSSNMLDYLGPWAGYGEQLDNGALTEEQKAMLQKAQEKKQIKIQEARIEQENFQPYSTFHWDKYTDYKGLSYLSPPSDFKPAYGKCYIPEKNTKTWNASNKQGFQIAKFFPKSGHFIMTGTAEGKVLLYDVMKNQSLAHTYFGHTKAVRDISFSNDGNHFLSCAFDGIVRYWDTEYGKVLANFKLKKIPFNVKFHPSGQKQNIFICASSNKKIMQFDVNTGKKEIDYAGHTGTVNTVTWIEQNKFVSSSDDKKIFVWEYGIPVVTKHVSDPEMHTITATTVHPSGEYFAGQSSDNQIVIYENKGGNFRRIRAKNFSRHFSAGYACGIDFSHDGQFLMTGDERGKVCFYDWKTCRLLRTLENAHPNVCIGVQWHPSEPTTILSCGWEGYLKLWQGK